MRKSQETVYRERALLVGVAVGTQESDEGEELEALARTAGAEVVARAFQRLERPHPRALLGAGKVEELAAQVERERLSVVLVDHDLTPAQVRNLETLLKVKVVDRTELILDIFATHARTAQAKLQVELAQLEYVMPRLRRMWTHLGQQVGGAPGVAGGAVGIGQRGPGEKQIEVDRRLAQDRIAELKRELGRLGARKAREVAARVSDTQAVSLVGYTNAGKSTLMNRLTDAGVLVEDRLFSTLDTRTRLWKLAGGMKVLLSDTVGFIRKLPHSLVSSFHATLEEVSQADLLLHVVDASAPDAPAQIRAVERVLGEIGADQKEMVLVFNKIDRFRDPLEAAVIQSAHPGALAISAATGAGIEALEARVTEILSRNYLELEVEIPAADGRLLADVYTYGVVRARAYEGDRVRLTVRMARRHRYKLAAYEVDGRAGPPGASR
jgi:GTP-binding protein HflX